MRISLLGKEKTHTSLEMMNMKVLCRGDEQCPGNVRIEITSDKDIFFHYRGEPYPRVSFIFDFFNSIFVFSIDE